MGKRFVLIGGNSGIGELVLRGLLEEGHECLVYSRSPLAADLQDHEMIHRQSWDVNDSFPGIGNEFSNVAGFAYFPGSISLKPFKSLGPEQFEKDMRINLLGAVEALQAVLPLFAPEGGSLLFFSSVAATSGMPYHASIAAAKAGLEGLVRSLAAEYAPRNIRVNAISLSLTDTPLASGLLSTPEKRTRMEERHPLKSIGNPRQAADLATMLLTGVLGWMTGQILSIDGGLGVLRT